MTSLYDLPKDILVKLIATIERPKYFLWVYNSDRHVSRLIEVIGPFYTEDETIEYLKRISIKEECSFLADYFIKHRSYILGRKKYKIGELSSPNKN